MADGEDFDGISEVVKADAVVSDAETQLGRLNILEALYVAVAGGEPQCQLNADGNCQVNAGPQPQPPDPTTSQLPPTNPTSPPITGDPTGIIPISSPSGPGGGGAGGFAAPTGPSYSLRSVCAASALLNKGGYTALDAVGAIPAIGKGVTVIQGGAALYSAGLSITGNGGLVEAGTSATTLGLTSVDSTHVFEVGSAAAKIVPVIGNLVSLGAVLNDIYGTGAMATYYDACMAGKV